MRLIDADKLHYSRIRIAHSDGTIGGYNAVVMSAEIKDAPTVDAVPVVRCKDCKWFGDFGCAIRIVDDSDKPTENDFCSFAERSETE